MRRVIPFAVAVSVAACRDPRDPCHDGVAEPGEVCFVEGAPLDDDGRHELMDFDGDGVVDLVAVHEGGSRFWHNRGDATFEAVGEVADDVLGGSPFVLPDLDGDGRDELGVFTKASLATGRAALSVFARANDSTVALQAKVEVEAPTGTRAQAVGDFDGDGARDIVFYGAQRMVLLHGADGGLSAPVELEPFGINANGIFEAIVGDLDGDGADELCHAWSSGLRVRSGPDLREEQTLAWPSDVAEAILADVDGDGADEVVAGWMDSQLTLLHVFVFERSSVTGALVQVNAYEIDALGLVLADVDGDGADDLVLSGERVDGQSTGNAYWLAETGHVALADGLGGFHPPLRIEDLEYASWRPAQLDDDGRVDLARFSCFPEPGPDGPCPHYAAPLLSDP